MYSVITFLLSIYKYIYTGMLIYYTYVCVCVRSCPIVLYTHGGNSLTVLLSGSRIGFEEVG